MKLLGKTILMVVARGVELDEVEQLKGGLEREGAFVLVTTPHPMITVPVTREDGRPEDLIVDIPLDAVGEYEFEGLLLVEGVMEAIEAEEARAVLDMVRRFYAKGQPVFASGVASEVLNDSGGAWHSVIVREGAPLSEFVRRAVDVLVESERRPYAYRATMAS